MRESAVEKTTCKWAKDHGIATIKLSGPGARGKSDRLFMKAGKTVFCELKAPGKEPTELQWKFIRERRADGFSAEFFDDAGLAIQWLRKEFPDA